jgi:tight adherence protein C
MTTEQILYLALIFVAVTAGALGVGVVATRGGELRARLRGVTAGSGPRDVPSMSDWSETVLKVAAPVAKLSTPTEEEAISQLRARFMHAGFRQASAPVFFLAAKTLLVVLLPVVYLLLEQAGLFKLSGPVSTACMLTCAAFGYYLPNVVLSAITRHRQRELFEAFPDAIDLMIVCVEAGLGLDMAINKAAEEMKLRSPELTEELDLVALELRVGATRARALRNFAMRTGLDEVASFATMLIQADRFGTSLADSLRVHADSLRVRRRLRAEEAAAKIPLKLLFPLIFFIFPSLLLVLLGPAMIQIYRVMLPAMAGSQ